jgi:WD40 repeat protein
MVEPSTLSILLTFSCLATISARMEETAGGKLLETLRGHQGMVSDLKWSPAGDRLVSGDSSGNVRVWNAAPSTAWRLYPPQAARGGAWTVQGTDWSSDGRYLIVAGGDIVNATEPPSFAIWDVQANQLIMENLGDALNVMGVHAGFSPDDQAILYTGIWVFLISPGWPAPMSLMPTAGRQSRRSRLATRDSSPVQPGRRMDTGSLLG